MESELRARLKAAPSVTTIVGTRIDWDVRPQRDQLPALVLETVIGDDTQHMGGLDTFAQTVVQFNCFAATKKQAVELREAVKAVVIEPATQGGVEFLRATDITRFQRPSNTEAQFVHHEILECRLWHT